MQTTQSSTDIDDSIEHNISKISVRPPPPDQSPEKPHHEEIVTRYTDYPKIKTEESNRSSYFRTSLSLQNLNPSDDYSVNTNNDFDQNTVIQPDKTYLIRDASRNAVANNKTKSEVDLIDAIGGSWAGSTDQKHLESYSHLRKSLDKNENVNNNYRSSYSNGVSKNSRNKSLDIISHLVEGSKTLPRKAKLLQESITNGKDIKKEEKHASKL